MSSRTGHEPADIEEQTPPGNAGQAEPAASASATEPVISTPLLDLVLSTELIPVVPAGAAVPFARSRSRHRRPNALLRFWRKLVAGLRRFMRLGRRRPPVLQPLSLTMGASGVYSPQAYEPAVSLEATLESASGEAVPTEPPTYAVTIAPTPVAPAHATGDDAALTALRVEVSQLRDEIRSTLEGLRMQQQVLADLVASVRAQEYVLQHTLTPSLHLDLERLAEPQASAPAEVSITMPVVEANSLEKVVADRTAQATVSDLVTAPERIDLTRQSTQETQVA